MTWEIALLLAQDGISTGAIYVLVALGIVLIFLVTRVIFVPFGDVVGYSALTVAALQLRQMPGTVWLVLTLAAIATVMEAYGLARRGQMHRVPKALLLYAVLPSIPAALVWLAAGRDLPMWVGIALTLAIVMPISPLLYRIAFRPLADASVLVLLIVAVAVFNIVATLVMVVNDKRTDIAILRTVGLSPRGVIAVFMTQGVLIGWIGAALGVALGLSLALNVDVIVPFLEQTFGFHFMDPDVYYISGLPSEVHAGDVVRIGMAALILTLIATVYPALQAARTQPAEALRYE